MLGLGLSESGSSLRSSASDDFSAVLGGHSGAETAGVDSLDLARLIGTFHKVLTLLHMFEMRIKKAHVELLYHRTPRKQCMTLNIYI